jgi:hypothetical protein
VIFITAFPWSLALNTRNGWKRLLISFKRGGAYFAPPQVRLGRCRSVRRLTMRNFLALMLFGFSLSTLAGVVRADTLVLRDGTQVSGVLVSATAQTIAFKDAKGVVHRYDRSKIQTLEFAAAVQKSAKATLQNKKLETLASGTEIVVRTNEAIDSKSATENQAFAAQVDQDVIGGSNNVVVPKGSPAEIVIRQVSSGGVTGSPEMALDVQSITVGGQRYLVSTADLQEKSETGIGANKRTAEAVGGGTALGAIVGAVVGKGKGAAIGAVVGAAGGAGTQILIKGKEVSVPSETVLKFQLDKPVSLNAAS